MRKNVYLLNRVPEHDCQTFFRTQNVNRTKGKPMHFEWEHFSDYLDYQTISAPQNETREKESEREGEREGERERGRERGFRRRVRRQYSAPSIICQYFLFLLQTSSKTETNFSCSTERYLNPCILNGSISQTFSCYTEKNDREREASEGMCADNMWKVTNNIYSSKCIESIFLFFRKLYFYFYLTKFWLKYCT